MYFIGGVEGRTRFGEDSWDGVEVELEDEEDWVVVGAAGALTVVGMSVVKFAGFEAV